MKSSEARAGAARSRAARVWASAEWFWVSNTVVRSPLARELGPEAIGVYLALCAPLGPERGGDQVALARLPALAERVHRKRDPVLRALRRLHVHRLVDYEEEAVQALEASQAGSEPGVVETPWAYRLRDPHLDQPRAWTRGRFFWADVRVFDHGLTDRMLALYGFLCCWETEGRVRRSLQSMERDLGLAHGSAGKMLKALERAGVIRSDPDTSAGKRYLLLSLE
jgi:hypothetical protein